MTTGPQGFSERTNAIDAELADQGRRVLDMVTRAFDALYARDTAAARAVEALDDAVDEVDLEIEQKAVALLADACRNTLELGDSDLRTVLTIVKINNELERTADAASAVAERVPGIVRAGITLPDAFRVMSNSVIGIVRDACAAHERRDVALARLVLRAEDTVYAFKAEMIKELESHVSDGRLAYTDAAMLQELAGLCQRVADYCTNMVEQVIYANSGSIVRHTDAGWIDVSPSSGS
ncbi:MAG: PhoU domain-containing protein [Planctomycetota bacterium]